MGMLSLSHTITWCLEQRTCTTKFLQWCFSQMYFSQFFLTKKLLRLFFSSLQQNQPKNQPLTTKHKSKGQLQVQQIKLQVFKQLYYQGVKTIGFYWLFYLMSFRTFLLSSSNSFHKMQIYNHLCNKACCSCFLQTMPHNFRSYIVIRFHHTKRHIHKVF